MKNFYNWFKSRIKVPVRVNTPRPYIVPTGIGFSYGLLVLVIIIVSVNNRNNLIFLFAFFLFSVGLVTMLFSHRNFEKIRFSFLQASLLFKNEVGKLTYRLENLRTQDSFMISVGDSTVDHIESRGQKDVQVTFKPEKYGLVQVPVLQAESYFPLRFLRVWRFIQPEVKLTIFPEKINYLSSNMSDIESQIGVDNLVNQEVIEKEISHFDRFQPTDAPHLINWKMLAKTDDLYINRYHSPMDEQKQIVIKWQDTESLLDIEKRKSQMSFWIDHLYKSKKPFTVVFDRQQVSVGSGDLKSVNKALRMLI